MFQFHSALARAIISSGHALALVIGLAIVTPAGATERPELDQIAVSLDQAKLLKLPAGTETIIIGNPAIADVSLQRNNIVVITGRTAGRTNFIALDASGTIISESMVSVAAARGAGVLVQRGMEASSYHCAPNCLPTLALGDEQKYLEQVVNQAKRREELANQPTRPR
ncbi:Pilus formation protein, N-terminal [Rhabdaerophilaceae bacterium]